MVSPRRSARLATLTAVIRYGTLPTVPYASASVTPATLGMQEFLISDLLLYSVFLVGLSSGITWTLHRINVLDIPNVRSSHDRPVPRIGGVAIVLTFFVGLVVFCTIRESSDTGRLGTRWIRCLRGRDRPNRTVRTTWVVFRPPTRSFSLRLLRRWYWSFQGHTGIFESIDLPFVGTQNLGIWGALLTVLWLVGITNAVNFMDGLDGLVAGSCVLGAVFFCVVTINIGGDFGYLLGSLLAVSTFGFFVFNFPRASIFMGDVGSQFLGFCFGALAVLAVDTQEQSVPLLVMPLLFFHFIFDTSFTFIRRLLAGEKVSQAHRTHLYQLVNQLGASHAGVSFLHFGLTAMQGIGAIVMLSLPPEFQIIVFAPFLVLEVVYAIFVLRLVGRRGLISNLKAPESK